MDKDGFYKELVKEGFKCTLKDGIPTVHADNKKALESVKRLAKELEYSSSFGIVFDGGATFAPEDDCSVEAAGDEPVEDSSKEAAVSETDATIDEPEYETISGDEEKDTPAADDVELYTQPSIFDMFDELG